MPASQPSPPRLPPGVKRVQKKKADGSVASYYYLRANGARVPAPDAPDFKAAMARALQSRGSPRSSGGLSALVDAYLRSPEYLSLRQASKYNRAPAFKWLLKLDPTEPEDLTRGDLIDMRDLVATRVGPGAANNFVACVSALFNWAIDRGKLATNIALRVKKLPIGEFLPWSDHEVEVALSGLPEHLRRIVVLALFTGQRRGDLVAMTWAQFDGKTIALTQQKSNRSLVIPVHETLAAELERWKQGRASTHILTNSLGRPWLTTVVSKAMQTALEPLGVLNRNIHGLRKVAATRLAEAGCSTHEIAAITGHTSLSMVAHYTRTADQYKLAVQAISRLETPSGNRRKNTT